MESTRRFRWTGIRAAQAALLLLITLAAVQSAAGQAVDLAQRQRILDEPFRLVLDEQVPTEKRVLFDWGGWFRSSFFDLYEEVDRSGDGDDGDYEGYTRQQLRMWGSLNLDQAHLFYARMRFDYINFHHGDIFEHGRSDWDGPNLDRAWYDFRLSRWQWAQGETPSEFDIGVRVGRQYVELGTGLALSLPLDALILSGYYADWQIDAMGALSVPGTENLDRSVPGESEEYRKFWGIQLKYHGWNDHRPFAYFFAQEDADAGDIWRGQTFGYDSSYVGGGSVGQFFHRDLEYTVEMVGELGQSFAWLIDDEQQHNIEAWAFDTELRYLVPDDNCTQFAVGYLLASGDEDRHYSPTNTLGGNMPGSSDNSFVAWGYRDTGLVMAPRLSNLGMVKFSASTYPINKVKYCDDLRVGSDLYVYHKQQKGGAVSDNLSIRDDAYLGHEIDLYLDWQLTSDLGWMTRYGAFWPGDGFIDQSTRQVLFTALTLKF